MRISNFLLALSALHSEIYGQEHFSDIDKSAKDRDDIKSVINEHLKADTQDGLDRFFDLFNEKIVENDYEVVPEKYIWDEDLRGEYFSRRIEGIKLEHSYRYFENLKCKVVMDISYYSWVLRQLNNFSYISIMQYTQGMSDCGQLAKKHFKSWDEYATSFYYDIYDEGRINKKYYNEALLMKLLFDDDSPWRKVAWSNS